MPRFTQEELDKLPKWARARVEALESDVRYYKGQVASATGESQTPSEVWISDFESERAGKVRYLPAGTQITFDLGDGGRVTFGRNRSSEPAHIRATADGSISHHIVITGESANAVNISTSYHRGVTSTR